MHLRDGLLFISLAAMTSIVGSRAPAAGLLIADGRFGGALEIKEHNVNVTINNGIAVTNVEQVFLNTESRIVEALYTFPVPKKASVANFSMWINGKEMIGEVVEKERAREIYESYKKQRVDPGLLEQVDFRRFEMRIFPIAAGAEQRVRLTYYQELDFDHDWATYVYPLATTTESVIQTGAADAFSFRLDAKSEVPIVQMESPSHQQHAAISAFDERLYRASLELADASLAEDVIIAYRVARPTTGIDLIANRPDGEDGYFQATVTVGADLAATEPGMDYVFVIDVSGSMKNRNKLNLSQASIYSFLGSLTQDDRFEIITFNDMPRNEFGQLVNATADRHQEAKQKLQVLRARGGTSLQPALRAAYRYAESDRELNVVVLSDGLTSPGESSALTEAIRARPENCRVFAVGVGNDVNRPLLRSMAERAGGLAAFLSENDNFERQASAFRRKLTRPAIENVTAVFDPCVYDIEPLQVANLYHGSPIRLYGRYRGRQQTEDPRGQTTEIRLKGTVLGAPWEKTVEVLLPNSEDANPEIERMWASYRVDRFMPEAIQGPGKARSELIALCEEYSIVSEFASFIVLENDAEYQRWNIARRNPSRTSRDRAAQFRVNEELRRLQDNAVSSVGPSPTMEDSSSMAPDRNSSRDPQTPFSHEPPAKQRRLTSFRPGGGGGGAFDPITGLLALGLGGLGWLTRNRD